MPLAVPSTPSVPKGTSTASLPKPTYTAQVGPGGTLSRSAQRDGSGTSLGGGGFSTGQASAYSSPGGSWQNQIGTPLSAGTMAVPRPSSTGYRDPYMSLLTEQLNLYGNQQTLNQASLQNQMSRVNGMADLNIGHLNTMHGFDLADLDNRYTRDIDLPRLQAQLDLGFAGQDYAINGLYHGTMRDILNRQQAQNVTYNNQQRGFADDRYNAEGRYLGEQQTFAETARRNDVLYNNAMRAAAEGDYNSAAIYLGQMRQFTQQAYADAATWNNQQRDFADKGIDLAFRQSALEDRAANRRLNDESAAKGSALSSGYRDTRLELMEQLGLKNAGSQLSYDTEIGRLDYADTQAQRQRDENLAGIDRGERDNKIALERAIAGLDNADRDSQLNLDRALSDIGYRRTSSTTDWEATIAGLDNQAVNNRLDYDRGIAGNDRATALNQLDWDRAQANNRMTNSYLDSQANSLGIDRERLEATLSHSIELLNLDRNATLEELALMGQSNDAATRAQASAITQQLLQYSATSGGSSTGATSSNRIGGSGFVPSAQASRNVRYAEPAAPTYFGGAMSNPDYPWATNYDPFRSGVEDTLMYDAARNYASGNLFGN